MLLVGLRRFAFGMVVDTRVTRSGGPLHLAWFVAVGRRVMVSVIQC
jgi:hypothetical protein